MATGKRNPSAQRAGDRWLSACAPIPEAVQRTWRAGALATIPSGIRWLVAEAPLLASVKAMGRLAPAKLGPVLASPEERRAWWLVVPDAAEHLDDIPRLIVHPPGWGLRCPCVYSPAEGRLWLERPDGSGRLTDPILLGAAFGPGGPRLPAEAFG